MAEHDFTIGEILNMQNKVDEINIVFFAPHLKQKGSQPSPEERGAGWKPYAEQLIDDLENGKDKRFQ